MSVKGKGRPWLNVCIGGAVSLIITGLLILMFTKLILSGTLPVSLSVAAACLSIALATVAGCTFTLWRTKSRRLLFALLSGGLYLLFLVVGNAVVFHALFHRVWLTIGIIMVVSLVCGLIGARGKKLRYHK